MNKEIVLKYFTAPWCGICKQIKPLLDGKEYVEVNVDVEEELSHQANIRGLPTLIRYKDGVEVGRISGGDAHKIKVFLGEV